KVGHLHGNLVDDRATHNPPPADGTRLSARAYRPVMGAEMQIVANPQQHARIIGIAKYAGALDDSLEGRSDIGRRGRDDLEHVAGGGLLLQRLLEIARLGLHLVEQADVLDGDDGLVGEGLDEFDLLVLKRADSEPEQVDDAKGLSFTREGNAQCGP